MDKRDERYERRVAFVRRRMLELGIDGQAGLAAAAGISLPTAAAWMGKLPQRLAAEPREETTGPLGRTLRVKPGWLAIVDAGENPEPLDVDQSTPQATQIALEAMDAKLDEILRLLRPPGQVSSADDTREALEQHVAQSREQARAEVGPTLRRLDAHDGERAARPRRQPRQQDHKV